MLLTGTLAYVEQPVEESNNGFESYKTIEANKDLTLLIIILLKMNQVSKEKASQLLMGLATSTNPLLKLVCRS
jgi:hypothetical protein